MKQETSMRQVGLAYSLTLKMEATCSSESADLFTDYMSLYPRSYTTVRTSDPAWYYVCIIYGTYLLFWHRYWTKQGIIDSLFLHIITLPVQMFVSGIRMCWFLRRRNEGSVFAPNSKLQPSFHHYVKVPLKWFTELKIDRHKEAVVASIWHISTLLIHFLDHATVNACHYCTTLRHLERNHLDEANTEL
jgi:hypothetical protein